MTGKLVLARVPSEGDRVKDTFLKLHGLVLVLYDYNRGMFPGSSKGLVGLDSSVPRNPSRLRKSRNCTCHLNFEIVRSWVTEENSDLPPRCGPEVGVTVRSRVWNTSVPSGGLRQALLECYIASPLLRASRSSLSLHPPSVFNSFSSKCFVPASDYSRVEAFP